jgi:hypothetical protein|tara:strand:- start:180 stop:596 length:417 start_codon:yes stop_codon:yes gene_type:complete
MKESKDYIESKTLWTSASLLISSAVSLVLHFTGANPLSPEMLGGAVTGAVSACVFMFLRLITRQPVGQRSEGNGTGAAPVLMLFGLAFALSCCGTITAKKSVAVTVKKGPPCTVSIDVDGKRAVNVKGPKACAVNDGR